MEELARLQASRSGFKGHVTRLYTKINKLLSEEVNDYSVTSLTTAMEQQYRATTSTITQSQSVSQLDSIDQPQSLTRVPPSVSTTTQVSVNPSLVPSTTSTVTTYLSTEAHNIAVVPSSQGAMIPPSPVTSNSLDHPCCFRQLLIQPHLPLLVHIKHQLQLFLHPWYHMDHQCLQVVMWLIPNYSTVPHRESQQFVTNRIPKLILPTFSETP